MSVVKPPLDSANPGEEPGDAEAAVRCALVALLR
jgi:hypothetical protein